MKPVARSRPRSNKEIDRARLVWWSESEPAARVWLEVQQQVRVWPKAQRDRIYTPIYCQRLLASVTPPPDYRPATDGVLHTVRRPWYDPS